MSSYLNLPVSWMRFVPYFRYKIGTRQRKQSHRLLAQVTRRRRKRHVHTIACDSRIKPSSLTCDGGMSKGRTSTGKRRPRGRNPFCQRIFSCTNCQKPLTFKSSRASSCQSRKNKKEYIVFPRTLHNEIINVECKGLCQVRFGNTFSRTFPHPFASSAQLCSGKSGLEFCGKEVT